MGEFLHIKRVVIGSQTFVSFSAHDLLAALSEADDSRPGHPDPTSRFLSTAQRATRPKEDSVDKNYPKLRIHPRPDGIGG